MQGSNRRFGLLPLPAKPPKLRTLIMAIDFTRKSILIIDDMPSMCGLLKAIAQSLGGKDIDLSYRAADAINRLAAKPYDIVLCDYYLGEGMNGQHILEQGRARGHIKTSTAFLMVTAEKSRGVVLGTLEENPDAYIVKPFNREIVQKTLERVLAQKEDMSAIHQAVERGDLATAISACGDKIQEQPENRLDYLKIQSGLMIEAERYAEAREIFEEILSERKIPWANLGMAKALYHAREYTQAKDVLGQLIANNKNHIECYDWLAKTYMALGDPVTAQRVLTLGVKLSPNSVQRVRSLAGLAVANNDIPTASRSYRELITRSKNSIYDPRADIMEFSQVLSQRGLDQEAREMLRIVQASQAATPPELLKIALIHTKAAHKDKNPAAAIGYLNEAKKQLRLAGDEAGEDDVFELIRSSLLIGETEYGKKLTEVVLQQMAGQPGAAEKLGVVYSEFDLGETLRDIAVMAEKDATAINRRGIEQFERKNYREAIELFDRACAEAPNDASMALNAAQAMVAHMRSAGAVDALVLRARIHLERAAQAGIEPGDNRQPKLLAMLDGLSRRGR